jgi:hypothetical protein
MSEKWIGERMGAPPETEEPRPRDRGVFLTTHWSVVLRAGAAVTEESAAALDLAEALAGKRDDGQGGHVSVSTHHLVTLRQLAEKSTGTSSQERWLRWFLIERLQTTAP